LEQSTWFHGEQGRRESPVRVFYLIVSYVNKEFRGKGFANVGKPFRSLGLGIFGAIVIGFEFGREYRQFRSAQELGGGRLTGPI
jgi:hypothetical protein